ncbi:MAG: hypothetical protein WCG80_14420 [Spirochaetales bacterium]
MKLFRMVSALVLGAALVAPAMAQDASLPAARTKNTDAKAGWETDKKPGSVSWYLNWGWYDRKYKQDVVTQKTFADTKIEVTYSYGDDDKLNTLFASGKLPDIMTIGSWTQIAKDAKKWAIPLDTIAKKYDPYFFKTLKPDVVSWYTQPDSHLYGYPNFSNTDKDYKAGYVYGSQAFLVRGDMYAALGKPDMTTPDGFLKGLRAAKAKYPDINPIGFNAFGGGESTLGAILQDFLAISEFKNGAYYDRYTDPEYLRWMRVFNTAYKEELISDDIFADMNQNFEENIQRGKYFAILADGVMTGVKDQLIKAAQADPTKTYLAIDGPKNSKGEANITRNAGIQGWTLTFISKDCKDPETAIHLITYMLSEQGQMVSKFGVEGQTYDVVKGVPTLKPAIRKIMETDQAKFDKEIGFGQTYMLTDEAWQVKNGYYQSNINSIVKPITEWMRLHAQGNSQMSNSEPDDRTTESRNLTNIRQKRAEVLLNAVMASSDADFDGYWKEYNDYKAANGWDKIAAIQTAKIKENRIKLGYDKK